MSEDQQDHDLSDQEKVTKLYEVLENPDYDDVLNDWERGFVNNNHDKQERTNFEYSLRQSAVIDKLYEKCYQKGCFDDPDDKDATDTKMG